MIAPYLREDCCNPPLAEQKDSTEDPDLSFPPVSMALSLSVCLHAGLVFPAEGFGCGSGASVEPGVGLVGGAWNV